MKKIYNEEQIIKILKEHEVGVGTGTGTGELCRAKGISQATFYKYKTKLINENFKIDWINKVVVSASIILPIIFLLMSVAEYLRRL